MWGAVGFFLLLPGGVLMAAGHGDIARSGLLLVLVGLALGVTQSVLPARSTGRTLALAGIAVLASLTAGAAALFSLVYAMCSQMK